MGYSHYWKIEKAMQMQEFKHLQTVAAKIVEASDAPVEFSTNTHPMYPSITVEGIASDAHETFYLSNHATKFEFCKTARKPYDEVVVGILDYADALGLLEFTSDGNFNDLAAGRKLASAHYERTSTRSSNERRGNFKKIPQSFEVEDGALGYVIDDQVIQLLNSMGEIICDTKDWATGDKRDLQNLFSLLKQEFTYLNVERKPALDFSGLERALAEQIVILKGR